MNSMRDEQRSHEIKVGLTILISLIVLIVAILSVGQHRGFMTNRYHLRILLSMVDGLQTGAPVRLAGKDVGSVVQVEFSKEPMDRKVEIIVEIDRTVQKFIRSDSRAHIGTLGLLGDKYVGITMGSETHVVLQENQLLQGIEPIDLQKLMDEGASFIVAIQTATKTINEISNKINRGTGTLGLLVNDPRMYINIDRLLVLMESLSRKIERGEGSIARFVADSTLYVNSNSLLISMRQLADSVKSGRGSIGKLLNEPQFADKLTETVTRFNKITQQLESGQGTLGQALTNKQLYEDLSRIIGELDALIKDIRKNPQRYLKVEIF